MLTLDTIPQPISSRHLRIGRREEDVRCMASVTLHGPSPMVVERAGQGGNVACMRVLESRERPTRGGLTSSLTRPSHLSPAFGLSMVY